MVKRKRPPEAGSWNLPGGKVDFGERIEDAIVREVVEEVGVNIVLTRPLGLVQMIGIDDQHWVAPVYLAPIIDGEPRNCEPGKINSVAWAPLDGPPSPLGLAAREALAAIARGS